MEALDWLTARPVTHRGLHDAAHGIVENTTSAVDAAIAGNFGIEVDGRPRSCAPFRSAPRRTA
jgi:glycerophosphoryl diester phosphodiesterase